MPSDALTQFAPSSVKTSTFRHTATQLSLPGGTPRTGNTARIIYSAASNASGANSIQWSVDVSLDNGSTWFQEALSDPLALSTTAQSGELYIRYRITRNSINNGGVAPLAALSVNITGAGASPTVTYVVDNVPSGPS